MPLPPTSLIGLISDTHGLLRPAVHEIFSGVDLILHAGDVGGAAILAELRIIAPVKAVLGNTDPPGEPELHETVEVSVDGLTVRVSHGHELGSPTPAKLLASYSQDILIYGHTHRPLVTRAAGRLVVNPGAAGPRRFDLHPTVGLLRIAGHTAEVEIVSLP